ncbi:MAG: KpsF/GutQ family sugar-phosphate isomerase [Sutterellaceae bacterium]|nr:KpsF/GutQ family sugar-phosphate isomerase [Sutterellaceae bacterium]MDD7441087.1 KpsF/GutQ family sugar-phosphate isomerase [Sutterellaceae bacterium]MDY2868926.1 KpsF/GutQ family sugar-phosphate isomerase [Mesosutterella sp.]
MNERNQEKGILTLAREVLRIESEAVGALSGRIGDDFVRAVQALLACKGRVVVTGIGKSGHIARKIAATMASTGTPAFFVHAAEASHGDLGMITRDDVVIGISYSGTTSEVLAIMPAIKREGAFLITMTGNPSSPLAKEADIHLSCHVEREACPLNLAPTASTTATLAMGDALAIACLDAKGFTKEDFARSHPGGALGRRLLLRVEDVMRRGNDIPCVHPGTTMLDAVKEISRKGIGMTAVTDETGHLLGVFTEGDLRRLIERIGDIRPVVIGDVMTRNPKTIHPEALAAEAASIMDRGRCNQLPVVDNEGRIVGALNVHDLMTAKVI